ncbi:MAG: roadblock/LC7 domain-containing protein [Planctomycetota bacterium]
MQTDQDLRDRAMVFYRSHVERIERILKEFARLSGAKSALLVDKDGHMITRVGEVGTWDEDTISALVAGSFAATKEMARLLGEEEFSALFHQGKRDNIQLSLVGDRTILTVIFDDSTTLGMVRLYVSEAVRKLLEVLEEARANDSHEDSALNRDYTALAKEELDRLFKGA